jgi:DNA invertase Pin-like site-specific DNA recombinase
MDGKFVAYYRVSRKSQGESGLGLEAQQRDVSRYLNGGDWAVLGAFVEVESAQHDHNRPKLVEAINLCKLSGSTLVIANLSRLSRDLEFIARLTKSEVDFVCCDMPSANRTTIHLFAVIAQDERERISQRTKAGLASIKARIANGEEHISKRGKLVTSLGGYRGVNPNPQAGADAMRAKAATYNGMVAPMVTIMRENGATLDKIAETLNAKGVRTIRGNLWSAMAVKRVLDRLAHTTPQAA